MTKRKPLKPLTVARCLIFRAYNDCYLFACGICNEQITAEDEIDFDHIHELADEGPDDYKNLRPVHRSCHRVKSAKSLTFRAHIKRLSQGWKKRKGPPIKSRPFPKIKRRFPS